VAVVNSISRNVNLPAGRFVYIQCVHMHNNWNYATGQP